MPDGTGMFSQKETVSRRINRARICIIRIWVVCVFYKLSIGGFRLSVHFFFSPPFISQANIRENERKVLAVRIGGSGGQMSLPDP